MPIEKISFSGLEQTQTKSEIKKEYIQKETPVEDTEKSKAAKYMIGAAALAGVVAVGIIGHKNNWWRKAQDIGEDITKKGSEAVMSGERKAGQTANSPSAGSVPGKGSEVNVELLDFSKLEGERSFREGRSVISQKDQNGKLLREYISWNNETISCINDYDPATGKMIKETGYHDDGKTIDYIRDYDPATGNKIKETEYDSDGKTIWFVEDYDPATGNMIKGTGYEPDGKAIRWIDDYDPATGNKIKGTGYYDDGKTINWIDDYDPATGEQIKETWYSKDGKTISKVFDYDPATGNKIKKTTYYDDGKTIKSVSDYDPATGIEKITNYDTDGNVIKGRRRASL